MYFIRWVSRSRRHYSLFPFDELCVGYFIFPFNEIKYFYETCWLAHPWIDYWADNGYKKKGVLLQMQIPPPPNYSHYVMKVILIGRLNRCLMIDECKNRSRITSKESPSPVGISKTDGEAEPSWKKNSDQCGDVMSSYSASKPIKSVRQKATQV
jgi:hypothetical protein